MNRIALLVLAALAIAVPAATAAPAQKEASPTIATLAAKTPQLSTLLSLVKKAGLADELVGSRRADRLRTDERGLQARCRRRR